MMMLMEAVMVQLLLLLLVVQLLLRAGGSRGRHLVSLGDADAALAEFVKDLAVVLRLPASLPRARYNQRITK